MDTNLTPTAGDRVGVMQAEEPGPNGGERESEDPFLADLMSELEEAARAPAPPEPPPAAEPAPEVPPKAAPRREAPVYRYD